MDSVKDDPDHQRYRCVRRGTTGTSWSFRHRCEAGRCKTYLFTASYYGVSVAQVAPDGRNRYLAVFPRHTVPCPHRPGEDAGTNQDHSTLTLEWSPNKQTLHGFESQRQVALAAAAPAKPPATWLYARIRLLILPRKVPKRNYLGAIACRTLAEGNPKFYLCRFSVRREQPDAAARPRTPAHSQPRTRVATQPSPHPRRTRRLSAYPCRGRARLAP